MPYLNGLSIYEQSDEDADDDENVDRPYEPGSEDVGVPPVIVVGIIRIKRCFILKGNEYE